MKLTLAKTAGFCYGVKRAVERYQQEHGRMKVVPLAGVAVGVAT